MHLLGLEVYFPAAALCALALYIGRQLVEGRKMKDIPTVGYAFPILKWITVVQHIVNARKVIAEGYRKYPNGVFRIATYDGWMVVAAGPQLIDDMRRAPQDTLSFKEAGSRRLQVKYTLGEDVLISPYYIDVVRGALNRNFESRLSDIRDEIIRAFAEDVGAGEEWKGISALETVECIVSRVSNRLFVDAPLCRNREWMKLTISYVVKAAIGAVFLNHVPSALRPCISGMLPFEVQRRRANELVGPLISERLRLFAEQGNKSRELPNDLITWLIEACPPELRQVPLLTNHILVVNFAAIHTTIATLSSVLYKLAANPEWVRLVREEVETILSTEEWSRSALSKMRRLDSLIHETQRLELPDLTTMNRWVCKPFTFSNGVHVPAGCLLVCAADSIHTDAAYHGENANTFNPWRYSDLDDNPKNQMVASSSTYLAFGYGRHACPGRYFAANALKGILAHLVLEYDMRFKEDKGPPRIVHIGNLAMPRDVQLEFRKRMLV